MRTKTLLLLSALAILHLMVIFAGFVAPYDPGVQDREMPYAPPTRLHFFDSSGFHLRPFFYASALALESYQEDRTREYPVHLFVRGGGYTILGILKSNGHLFRGDEPARLFVFGADGYGRGWFSRLLYCGEVA